MNIRYKLIELSEVFYKDENNNLIVTIFWNSLYIAFFLLPLGINLPTPFFIVSIVLGFVNIFRSKIRFASDNKALLLFPLYFVIMALSLVYTDNISDGVDLVQRSLSLLLFPIIFLFVKEDASTVKKLFDFLLFGLIVSFVINFSIAFYDSITTIKGDFNSIRDVITSKWNNFIGDEFSKLINPSYLSLYILLVLSYYLKKTLVTKLRTVIVFLLFLYLFLLASRAAYLILLVMSVLLIFTIKDKTNKYTMCIVFCMGLVIFANNPRAFGFYENMMEYDNSTSEKLRVLTWNASIKLIKEAPLLGYGVGDANDILIKKYKELGYLYNYKNRYNAHNQFFQTLLQTGIFGFGVLLSIFILLATRMRRSSNEFSVFLILVTSLLFESMLVRFNGIVFFSIVIPLLLKKRSILSSRIIRNISTLKDMH